ncbi:hypothetical protein C8Q74DRAFT_1234670 [Fomes fomentarius]|nr:hypothetical protein C8Q74DRAFT_1234670 [Fomes fomentarius]
MWQGRRRDDIGPLVFEAALSAHACAEKFKTSPAQETSRPPSQSSSALPGVQKIKAALRQTRRLLAKDKLAADVRVATERRLKSLETDLARAEQARVERTLATRYHKIKFFERQKVTRRLLQTKKQLAAATEKKERKKLEARLAELRVDLNYILHYPKTKKYISLFPPEVRNGEEEVTEKRKSKARAEELSETDRQREEIRRWIREQMDGGGLSWEPEDELARAEGGKNVTSYGHDYKEKGPVKSTDDARGEDSKLAPKPAKGGVADDEFFGADDDEEDEDSGAQSEESSGDGDEEEGEEEDSEMDED